MKTILIALSCTLVAARAPAQTTTRLSLDSAGNEAQGPSSSPALSFDGRFAAFESSAPNLVPGDTNAMRDIFVMELATGLVELVSVSSAGAQADTLCTRPSLSHDGRLVAFHSGSFTLVPGDANGMSDVFLRDRLLGTTVCISVTPAGASANSISGWAALAADGSAVAFSSNASDLGPGDANNNTDVYVRALAAGTNVRASVPAVGGETDGYSTFPSISADGRFVAYQSVATNLVLGDANGVSDVFVRDLAAGTTVRASVPDSGGEADGSSTLAAISADGRFVAFQSNATNLVLGDTNGVEDVFVRDLVLGTTVRASRSLSGGEGDQPSVAPAISADGRCVAFVCLSEILIAGDTNLVRDVLVADALSGNLERLSVDSASLESDGMSLSVALDGSGTRAVFQSFGENLVPNDTNGVPDVFLRLRGPFHALACFGDGTQSPPCPCGNNGAPGHGCANSAVAAGGVLEGQGGTALDEVTLVARDLNPHALAIVLQGDVLSPAGLSFGDGLRCVSGTLRRLYVANAEFGTLVAPGPFDLGLRARAQALGDPLPPGALRGYQVYYRDPSASFCPAPSGNTWNVTNAVAIQW